MKIEIKAPQFPESVPDGTIATWHKKPGEQIARDELLVDIETDKVVLEVVAPSNGILGQIIEDEGTTVLSNQVIAVIDTEAEATNTAPENEGAAEEAEVGEEKQLSPAAKKLVAEYGVDLAAVQGSGKGGRVTKEDVLAVINGMSEPAPVSQTESVSEVVDTPSGSSVALVQPVAVTDDGVRPEKRVPMTRLRARIAERLLDATQSTAMLTTFNEVNMQPVIRLRKKYKDHFEQVHNGTRLGFMSFFVKAAVEALKRFPSVNASLDGNDIVYHGYQDVGVAVSSDKGLVVPVLRDSENLGLADIENKIRDFGIRAKEGKLSIDEMTGGTFTITNGGVFGSLISTPILNPPQTAILGMHKIQERPMAVNGEVVILPMMYLALTYDHRLIDGKEAVQFLVTIKDMIEDPARILLEI